MGYKGNSVCCLLFRDIIIFLIFYCVLIVEFCCGVFLVDWKLVKEKSLRKLFRYIGAFFSFYFSWRSSIVRLICFMELMASMAALIGFHCTHIKECHEYTVSVPFF